MMLILFIIYILVVIFMHTFTICKKKSRAMGENPKCLKIIPPI